MAAGKRVILPLTVRDPAASSTSTGPSTPARTPSRRPGTGCSSPPVAPLGRDAIATPDAVLVPGLAVSSAGYRIGKGAGCYDRALARVPAGTFVCVLLYDDEVGRAVPVEPHDHPVTAAVTPRGITRLG